MGLHQSKFWVRCHVFFARYPYVSHLICNAGVASFAGVDYSVCFKQFFGSPVAAVSTPEYYIQRRGELSVDGLGWVWQCNVFGHYALVRYCLLLIRAPFNVQHILLTPFSLVFSTEPYSHYCWHLAVVLVLEFCGRLLAHPTPNFTIPSIGSS